MTSTEKSCDKMTTIDLNPTTIEKNDESVKLKRFDFLKSFLLGLTIFMVLSFCIIILVLLINRIYLYKEAGGEDQISFQILFSDKDKISACKTTKNFQDCCYIFFKAKALKNIAKCTPQKILNLFLQYELQKNKRSKRQYISQDGLNYADYDTTYDETLPQNFYYDPTVNDYQQFYSYYNDYYNDNLLNPSPPDQQNPFLQLTPAFITTTTIKIETSTADKTKENVCKENSCTNSSKEKTNLRISQGTEFHLKQPNEVSLTQIKQANPCFYPMSSFNNVNPQFGMVSMNPNLQKQQPLYVINPSIYPSAPLQYQNYNNFNPINSPQVVSNGGQYYLCNPISVPTNTNNINGNNVAMMPGVEIRRTSEAFNLQEMLEGTPNIFFQNQTREAIECPFGTHSCRDGSKCIHNRQLCDNEAHCIDGSDEINCSCKNRVGEIRWCDGYLDCPNGEDEENCFDCTLEEFSCDDWSRFHHGSCIPLSQRCDGVKNCEITGKDEEDCSILTDHLGQHLNNKISNAAGFLHRNYKGKWYPTCFGVDLFAMQVCKSEAGPTDMLPRTNIVPSNDIYFGPYIDFSPTGGMTLADNCLKNSAVFVECAPLFCGSRLTITNPFRNREVDTSAEDFLVETRYNNAKFLEPLLGDSRVVGGKASQPTAWPWAVSIYKNGVFHCGGALFNEMWILTAAHCVDKFWFFYYEIQAGILRRFSYSPMEQTRWATIVIPHEGYSKKTLKNDIALMKLSKPVRFNRFVRPICLPSEATAGPDFLHGPKANTVCVTVGWGATIEHGSDPDHLREVEVPILSTCKHKEDREGDEICAGLFEGGKDACQGDSGGPLMCQSFRKNNQWYLAGIVSHGEGCARPNEPGVYTKVSRYLGWINENIGAKTVGRLSLQKCPGFICLGVQKCIPKKKHCNKIVDCLFGDDELDCWQQSEIVGEKPSLFKRFLRFFHLDKTAKNGTNLVPKNRTSLKTKEKLIVDAIVIKLAEETTFKCKNIYQVIPFDEKCNKVYDCEDGSDELNCTCVDYLKRFNRKAIGDGIIDCKDMTDESQFVKCPENYFLCHISQKCIQLHKRCDEKIDCINAEDEWDCVALTNGRTLVLDSDLRPKQSMKGIITINRFGVWRPLCSNASVDSAASIAANVCNLLAFEGYTVFHKLTLSDKALNITVGDFNLKNDSLEEHPICSGLFVRCLNVTLDDHIYYSGNQDNSSSQAELYTYPWNALIYLNGQFRCTGTILNPHWIITVATCLNTFQLNIYMTAIVGKGRSHLEVEGPHEQTLLINGIAFVNNSDALLLYTEQKIDFNRYVKPSLVNKKLNSKPQICIAIGFDNQIKPVVLKYNATCFNNRGCFYATEKCKNNTFDSWNGIITCKSDQIWYATALYINLKTKCQFRNVKTEQLNKFQVEMAMGNNMQEIKWTECLGFRCQLGNCIDKSKVCDGIPNCRNGEDENRAECDKITKCHLLGACNKSPACRLSEFKCPNGKCVSKSLFCNTINDCGDNFDEPDECSCLTYLQTIHPEKICDGTVNCWDRSDENPERCHCRFPANITCGRTNQCVSKEQLCDGFNDCPGGEDEVFCYSLKTNLGSINSGEVLKRTAGVWHSGCFAQNYTTSELEEICQRLGFAGGSARQVISTRNNELAMKAVMDRFDVIWIRRQEGSRLRLQLRTGNSPYVQFISDDTCHKLFIDCM